MKYAILALFALTVSAAHAQVIDQVDWAQFLSRQDMVWSKLPDRWDAGAFLGNGQLGAMIFTTSGGKCLKWHIGRSDVAFMGARIPIGDMVLHTAGSLKSGSMRLDLWNAQADGTLITDKGQIQWHAYTHARQMVQVIEIEPSDGEKACTFAWEPGLAVNPRLVVKKMPVPEKEKNPSPTAKTEGAVSLSIQPYVTGGGHATAWTEVAAAGRRTLLLSVGFSAKNGQAEREALAAIQQAQAAPIDQLRAAHRDWWHAFWPASFVSVPDARIENFYWAQMYKLGSATRSDRPAIDLMGPWFNRTPWPAIWWNLNIQLTYWPVLASNRLELGESLCKMLDNGAENLAKNAGEFSADSATVSRVTSYDCAGKGGSELCNLPWTMHNYYLQYRYCMDDAMLRDRIFPLLKRSINYYLHLLVKGPDGKLHIPRGLSPEYPDQPSPNPDCNIDLALLRWGCQTLLATCQRLKINDPLIPQWKQTLENLTAYPTDQNGLMISAKVPFAQSHRHYSHLLMIYPLYIMNVDQPENRELVIKSLKHWMGMPKALQGYSFTGACSISALMENGDDAVMYFNKLLDMKIHPNTMYTEAGPVIETPLSAAASLHDMLLSSWGDRIRVFPAVPHAWKDVTIHNMRTEGAFLVSASRRDGKTQWVRIKSLAGETCRIRPGLDGAVKAQSAGKSLEIKDAGQGVYELPLGKGEEALLYSGDAPPATTIAPVSDPSGKRNCYGVH